jgi:hypothetical protein
MAKGDETGLGQERVLAAAEEVAQYNPFLTGQRHVEQSCDGCQVNQGVKQDYIQKEARTQFQGALSWSRR